MLLKDGPQHRNALLHHRMVIWSKVHCGTIHEREVAHHRAAYRICPLTSVLICHPAMDTTATTIHPEKMLESKVLSKSSLQYRNSSSHEAPTAVTHRGAFTTGTNAIVVIHIDIEDHLTLYRIKVLRIGVVVLGWSRINRSDIEFDGYTIYQMLFQSGNSLEGVPPGVDIIRIGKTELTVPEGDVIIGATVAQPLKHLSVRKEARVVDLEHREKVLFVECNRRAAHRRGLTSIHLLALNVSFTGNLHWFCHFCFCLPNVRQ
mmetsp:Transcript_30255/g.76101  ORF Transcript_30255/g.76101 Transcript_30255/m.76101 type:complete len:261 (+) Transcript_30255:650-1432(+)